MLKKIAFGAFLLLTAMSIVFALRSNRTVTTSSEEAYRHYLVGNDLCDKFYFRQSAQELEQAVQLDTMFAVAQAKLAICYRNLGFDQKSNAMYARAEANKPHVSERERLLIDIWIAVKNSETGLAGKLAQQYLDKYPKYLEGYTYLAEAEYGRENWEKSLELYQQALKVDPHYVLAYNMLGYLNYYLGRYDDALAALAKYIEVAPEQANPHDSRGEILHAIGRYEEAITEFRQAYNINPEVDFAVLHMANSYLALGQKAQADNCYQLLLTEPANENKRCQYLREKAESFRQRMEYDSALTVLREVPAIDPSPDKVNTINAAYGEVLVYYNQRNLPGLTEARDQAGKAIVKLFENKPAAMDAAPLKRAVRLMEALAADLQGDLDKATSILSEIVDSTATPSEKIQTRACFAEILWHKGDTDRAMAELQRNLTINPNHTRTLILLGDICQSEGKDPTALAFYQRALDIWKDADANFLPLIELQRKLNSPVVTTPRERSI